jgi:1-acyl-sn-glycerol-3-phosphate acyltransferase
MRYILGIIRIILVFTTIFWGVLLLACLFPFGGRKQAHALFMSIRWVLLWIVGVKVHGPKFENIGPGIIMANHRSYLDVLFVPTSKMFSIVGKAEVKNWPFIGWAAQAMGVIWVKRESSASRAQTRYDIIHAIEKGHRVVLFPEGTSWEGPLLLPIKPAMFYESARRGFDIYQWSIHFDTAKTGYPRGINFFAHLWAVCSEPKINAYVSVRKEPLRMKDGEEMLAEAKRWWLETLTVMSEEHPARHSGYWPDARREALLTKKSES